MDDVCPDCGKHHAQPGDLIKAVLVKALQAQADPLAEEARAAPELRGNPLKKPLTAKRARAKRLEKNRVPICVACGDLCDRDDWLDYVACLACGRALSPKDVEWVDVEKLLGYQRVKRTLRQRAARRVAKWIKRQLG